MKYRKLPVVIDAIRYDGLNKEIVEEFVGDFLDSEINDCEYIATGKVPPIRKLIIQTLEGKMFVSPGDYVIKGVNGEFYPCKPDIFYKTYEPITNAEAKAPGRRNYKKRVLFDFDGVIHSYVSGWKGAAVIPDPPVEGIRDVIQTLRGDDYEIVVFTTRAETMAGSDAVLNYLKKHDIEVDAITGFKLPAILCVDDRAICFDGNTLGLVDKIKAFQSWTKK